MTFRITIKRFLNACRTFSDDTRGLSAIEFAFILPVMIIIYFGTVEISQLLTIDGKVTKVASTTADLVSQSTTLDDAQIADVFEASTSIIAPFTAANVSVVISSVESDAGGNVTVAWSDAYNGSARTAGSPITLPAGLLQPNTSLIFSEVSYNYTSIIGEFVSGTVTLTDNFYARPRNSLTVERN